ncbi:bifunctional phosphoribosylaminoimidazolecarboxamide formyltransferase/IMP cyclohydrolase [soil metagenome]
MTPNAHAAPSSADPVDLIPIRRALISVSDKAGIVDLARALAAHHVEIISTGGTADTLRAAGLTVRTVEDLTDFPEMMDGRVKTLHPRIHGGLLARRDDPRHVAAMAAHAIPALDLVCVNLYPFEATVARPGVTRAAAVENIDIGGPSMIRSAAKNHDFVAVLTDAAQYAGIIAELAAHHGQTSLTTRRRLAREAFARTARYDAAIATYFENEPASDAPANAAPSPLPARLRIDAPRLATLRYGENPHQRAAAYRDEITPRAQSNTLTAPSILTAHQLHGKELSYNNLADGAAALDLAWRLAAHAAPHALSPSHAANHISACIIKHANPCGSALASSPLAAIDAAIAGDPVAAFGGIVACSAEIDAPAAERLCAKGTFFEVILAPAFTDDALTLLRERSANVRLLATGAWPLSAAAAAAPSLRIRSIPGGWLAQDADTRAADSATWTHAAGPAPTRADLAAAEALELIVAAGMSNAIAIGGHTASPARAETPIALFGIGVGQVDRVTACALAIQKAGPRARRAIALSDAFFPFADGPTLLADDGVAMLVHPGGSKRDQETLDLCHARNITCMLTGVRRFRH